MEHANRFVELGCYPTSVIYLVTKVHDANKISLSERSA
jgi:hypothetical protein